MRRFTALIAGLFIGAAVIVAGPAAFSHGGDSGQVHACVGAGGAPVRIVAATATCPARTTALDWGIRGPAGPAGQPGPAGAPGAAGPPGASGSAPDALAVIATLDVSGARGPIVVKQPVLGLDWKVNRPTDPTGQATGRTRLDPVSITADLGETAVVLFRALTDNQTFTKAVLGLLQPGETVPYMTMTLTDAQLTGLQTEARGQRLLQHLTLRYRSITWSGDNASATATAP